MFPFVASLICLVCMSRIALSSSRSNCLWSLCVTIFSSDRQTWRTKYVYQLMLEFHGNLIRPFHFESISFHLILPLVYRLMIVELRLWYVHLWLFVLHGSKSLLQQEGNWILERISTFSKILYCKKSKREATKLSIFDKGMQTCLATLLLKAYMGIQKIGRTE